MAFINRRTFKVKRGKNAEALAVLRETHEAWSYGYSGPIRMYSPVFGTENLIVVEYEYSNLTEYESMWAAYTASPEAAAFQAKFGPLEATAHHNELRRLVAATDLDGSANNIAVRFVRYIASNWQEVYAANMAELVTPREGVVRISSPETGWWAEITIELEYRSLCDYEARVAERYARPTTAAYLDVVDRNLTPEGRTEVWRIHH